MAVTQISCHLNDQRLAGSLGLRELKETLVPFFKKIVIKPTEAKKTVPRTVLEVR